MTAAKRKKYSFMNQSIERALAILDAFDRQHPAWGAKDLGKSKR